MCGKGGVYDEGVWQRGCGEGMWQKGMWQRGLGGVCGEGLVCREGGVAKGASTYIGVCIQGGLPTGGLGRTTPTPPRNQKNGRYASYWNVFLFLLFFRFPLMIFIQYGNLKRTYQQLTILLSR